jgi:DNA-binding NarL/FixJ family response regulator
MNPVDVLVVDDHPVARRGLKLIVTESLEIGQILEADCAADALVMARDHRPDLVVMDMYMPGSIPARELCGYLHAALPDARIVLVTAFDRLDDIRDCLATGASGCLLKDTSEIDLGASLLAILAGEIVIDPRIAARLDQKVASSPDRHEFDLTSRERDVLALLAEGCSNRKIGERLHLSEATVKGYVTSLLEKLGVSSRLEAVVQASQFGLLGARR